MLSMRTHVHSRPVAGASAARISVVVATCNGSQFVEAQLRSILDQGRPADEIVLADDASTDATLEIASGTLRASTVPVRVLTGDRRVGPTANFERAIAAATGDVIVLADQDDVWRVDRLSAIDDAFRTPARPALVFSDATLIDAASRPLPGSLWRSVGVGAARRRQLAGTHAFDLLMRRNLLTGATVAFAAEMRPLLLPMSTAGLHDVWIGVLCAAVGSLVPIPQPLVAYRIHAANTAGLGSRSLHQDVAKRRQRVGVHAREAEHYRAMLDRLALHPGVPPRRLDLLRAKAEHLEFRAGLPGRGPLRTIPIAVELLSGKYHHYSRGLRSALYDLTLS
jgi:glycosyltransferase involved in cell wall biosynthesis